MAQSELEQLFEDLADAFLELKVHQEPSEVHGVLTGMLVRTSKLGFDEWLALLEHIDLDVEKLDDRAKTIMQELYKNARDTLSSSEFDFQLLMPADDYDLGERANALAAWSSGFLTGYGLASKHEANLSADLMELLNHLHAISELDDQLAESEQNEKDLYELYEYVRLGVMALQQNNVEEEAPDNLAQAISEANTRLH